MAAFVKTNLIAPTLIPSLHICLSLFWHDAAPHILILLDLILLNWKSFAFFSLFSIYL